MLDLQVQTRIINNVLSSFTNARSLHAALASKRLYNNWIQYKLQQANAVEEQDYIFLYVNKFVYVEKNGKRFQRRIQGNEYWITTEFAKHLAMLEGTETGRKVRQYFIDRDNQLSLILSENIKYSNELQRIVKMKYFTLRKFAKMHNLKYYSVCKCLNGQEFHHPTADAILKDFGIELTRVTYTQLTQKQIGANNE